MRELLEILDAWQAQGADVGRAVVIRTFGSAPRPEGAVLATTADGRIAGSVSGGCVEGAAAAEIEKARQSGRSRVIRYGISDEQAWDVGLACGGTIDVLVEPRIPSEAMDAARAAGAAHPQGSAIVTRLPPDAPPVEHGEHEPGEGWTPRPALKVDGAGGLQGDLGSSEANAELIAAATEALRRGQSRTVVIEGEQHFIEVYPVRPRLVIVGATEIARSLVAIAADLGYERIVIDARPAFAAAERFADVDQLINDWPDVAFEAIDLGPNDAVAILSHDPKFDEPAIAEAVRRGAGYVGAVGSRKTQADRRTRLREAGLNDDEIASVRGPIGLDLGGRAPAETALAIMAEIVASRYGGSGRPMLEARRQPAADAPGSTATATPAVRPMPLGPAVVSPHVRPLILAAGAGSRFGGEKLSARVDGRPVLRHVIDAVRAAAAGSRPVVVLGPSDPPGVDLTGTTIVRNPEPERGLASSLRIGWDAALRRLPREDAAPDAVLVLLGDQPLVDPALLRTLSDLPSDRQRPIVVPRYRGSAARNPVRIETTAGALVGAAEGDRGLGPIIDANLDSVRWLDVEGDNPDVDTAADLAHVADLAWADRVRRNREQVDRFREEPDGPDFYSKVSSIFRDDPDRTGDPVLDALRAHARPDDTWLDIGAGAGRYALPLARTVRRVLALDPSPAMLEALRAGMGEHGIDNVDVLQGRWPEVLEQGSGPLASALPVDVSLNAHVGYDVEQVWPFLEAIERATRRECLAVLMERSPAMLAEAFWPQVHGERRIALPALPALVDLLTAHGRRPEVTMLESSRRRWGSRDEIETYVRRQTWVAPGSAKDARMQALIDRWLVELPDGTVELSVMEPLQVGLVAWEPGSRPG